MKVRLSPPFLSSSFQSFKQTTRFLSTKSSPSAEAAATEPALSTHNARWLSSTKARIGKCIMFGLNTQGMRKAAEVCGILGSEWRELVAGREGFLTGRKRAGLVRQAVVWGEMDCMGHVNNVTYVRYAESARIGWASNYALHIDPSNAPAWRELWTPRGDGLILRSMRTDYKFPMTHPDRVSVFHKLRALPGEKDDSFVLDVCIMSELHQRPAARCVEDIVVYDYRAGKKVQLRGFMMDAFKETWKEQEAERKRVERRIGEVESMVKGIENESWRKEGAVEEIGGR